MSNLPHDLVEEILSRVPATALSRFRYTCKRWDALFEDQRFTEKHFDRAQKHFLAIMLNERRVSLLRVNLHGIDDDNNNNNNTAPWIKFKGEFSLKDPSSYLGRPEDIFEVFHCDGLLLLNPVHGLVVWNPCTGETKRIKPSYRYSTYPRFSLGYENNKSSCRNYKLLSYSDNPIGPPVDFEIYEFNSGLWRVLNGVNAYFTLRNHGISFKGNTYWIAENNSLLISFDFSTERFGCFCLPFETLYRCNTSLTTVREEKLSVLRNAFGSLKIEIWVTTNDKIDHTVVLSWSKLFAIKLNSISSRISFFIEEEEEEKKVIVCCYGLDTENSFRKKFYIIGKYGVYKEIDFGGATHKSGRPMIFSYVPSLVHIQGAV